MPKAYLTIDDGPGPQTHILTEYLQKNRIPAMYFVVGERIQDYPNPLIEAVSQGIILANHSFSHPRFSEISFEEAVAEIEKTEELIEAIYVKAGVKRHKKKYFRFPHCDRGMGGYIIDYDQVDKKYRETVKRLFADGLNITLDPPSDKLKKHAAKLQKYLEDNKYVAPFENMTIPWWQETELSKIPDCQYTFSTSDWMMLDRHRGKWPYKTLNDLKGKIDDDPDLWNEDSAHIILAHDKIEPELFPVTKALIDHMWDKGMDFIPFEYT